MQSESDSPLLSSLLSHAGTAARPHGVAQPSAATENSANRYGEGLRTTGRQKTAGFGPGSP